MMEIDPATTALTIRLQDLPQVIIKQVLSHLCLPFLASRTQKESPLPFLRAHSRLRLLGTVFRDAFDTSVTSLNLTTLPPDAHPPFILHTLPRFTSLTTLVLYPNSLNPTFFPAWRHFLTSRPSPPITSLTFVAPRPSEASAPDPFAELFAAELAASVQTLSTSCMPLLLAFACRAAPLTSLELLMDGLRPDMFPAFRSLRTAKLLYRTRIQPFAALCLVKALQHCQPDLRAVELRLNYLPTSDLAFVPDIPRLRKLSLFDGEVDGDGKGLLALARCAFLEDVHLEWIKGLTGKHLEALAVAMGARLKHLKIWNCDEVNDTGLEAVATHCPGVELELKFERDQFSPRTLVMFGERVSWESYAR